MADVRNLLKNERQARRITHPYATYSTTGKLICLLCQTQLKSESLWSGHLSSSQHQARVQILEDEKTSKAAKDLSEFDASSKLQDYELGTKTTASSANVSIGRKRKASESGDDDDERKRSKRPSEELIEQSTPAQSGASTPSKNRMDPSVQELQLPSRPATPQQTPENTAVISTTTAAFDEDEWAAFEADIATADKEAAVDATISAPAISTADLAAQSMDETNIQRKERQEAELEGDKEDAARKLEEEFEEMEGFEERVRKLKEKREALRLQASKDAVVVAQSGQLSQVDAFKGEGVKHSEENEEDDGDSDDDDDWDGFRLK